MVVQVFAAHKPVDRRAPVAPVAAACAVVNVEHRVAVVGQIIVKHKLPGVAAPPFVDVLEVTGAVYKNHCRAAFFGFFWAVQTGRHFHAVAGREPHNLGVAPFVAVEFGGGGFGQLAHGSAGFVFHHIKFPGPVAVRMAHRQQCFIGGKFHLVGARLRSDFFQFAAIQRQAVEMLLVRPFSVCRDVEPLVVFRQVGV